MAKATTEQMQKSKDKKIIQLVGREFFQMYCDENKVLVKAMDNLMLLANDSSDKSNQARVNMFLVEQLIGKAKQGIDLGVEKGIEIKITRSSLDEGDKT